MSRQRLLRLLWHESLAQPLTPWASGRRDHGRLMYGSARLAATVGLFANDLRNLWLRCEVVAKTAILRNPFHGVICPVGRVAARYDRRKRTRVNKSERPARY